MKIYILYNFTEGPWGGANQFLSALRKVWSQSHTYSTTPENADVIIFNSFPFRAEYLLNTLWQLKRQFPEKIILLRVDGPISGYRNKDLEIDKAINLIAKIFADAIVFQSQWSQLENKRLFQLSAPYETVIHNAPDDTCFSSNGKTAWSPHRPTRLVASSWSSHPNKGLDVFQWIDRHLDPSQYEMTFIGNTSVPFQHIRTQPALPSKELAQALKQHDIYVFGSRIESCSNALIEAMTCGLPVLAPNTSSNPEVVRDGGELFTTREEIPQKLEALVTNYEKYQTHLPQYRINAQAQAYANFAHQILQDRSEQRYQPKQLSMAKLILFFQLKVLILLWKIKGKLASFL